MNHDHGLRSLLNVIVVGDLSGDGQEYRSGATVRGMGIHPKEPVARNGVLEDRRLRCKDVLVRQPQVLDSAHGYTLRAVAAPRSSTPADPHAQGEATKHGIAGGYQFEPHPVTRADVGTVNVDLPHVQRRPCVRQLDHPVDDWTDRVVAN